MRRLPAIALITGLFPLVALAAEDQPLEVEILDTVMLQDDPLMWTYAYSYCDVLLDEHIHYDPETGLLSWVCSTAEEEEYLVLGDEYVALIGCVPENYPYFDFPEHSVYAVQAFRAPASTPFTVGGEASVGELNGMPAIGIIRGITLEMALQILQYKLPGRTAQGYPDHYNLPGSSYRHVQSSKLTPLGDGWYRYHAVIGVSGAHIQEKTWMHERTSAQITFYDTEGWAVLTVEHLCDIGIISHDEPLTGEVYCEHELAGFKVATAYNVAGG